MLKMATYFFRAIIELNTLNTLTARLWPPICVHDANTCIIWTQSCAQQTLSQPEFMPTTAWSIATNSNSWFIAWCGKLTWKPAASKHAARRWTVIHHPVTPPTQRLARVKKPVLLLRQVVEIWRGTCKVHTKLISSRKIPKWDTLRWFTSCQAENFISFYDMMSYTSALMQHDAMGIELFKILWGSVGVIGGRCFNFSSLQNMDDCDFEVKVILWL
jgi:hypothetical protein